MATGPEGLPSPDPAREDVLPSSEDLGIVNAEMTRRQKLRETAKKIQNTLNAQNDGEEPTTDEMREMEEMEREKKRLAQAEKVRRLRFEVLTPDHLDNVGVLYDKQLLSAEALEEWFLRGDSTLINKEISERGRMFNLFDPDPETLAEYLKINPDYLSVREQMRRDMEESMKGDSEHGNYLVVGLYDDKKPNVLRAYLSLRYPPQQAILKMRYKDHLASVLTNRSKMEDHQLQYSREWDVDKMKREFPNMMEIDTISVENGFGGASYLMILRAIELMEERGFEDPESVIYYRSHTMTLRKPDSDEQDIMDMEPTDEQLESVNVQNFHSGRFFSSLGFTEMLKRSEPADIMIRRLSNGQWGRASMEWEFGHKNFAKMKQRLFKQLAEKHLFE